MRRARRLLVLPLTAALGLAGALGLAAASAAHADTTTTVPNLTAFNQMAVDSTDGYVFLSGSVSGTPAIVVTSLSGQYETTLDSGDQPVGLALDGSTLYAALSSQGEIGVIDAATLTQTKTIALPTGDEPVSLAVQSGQVWVSYINTTTAYDDGIGEIDPSTGAFTPVATGLTADPTLVADPSDSGVLVAASSTWVATYNTSVTPAAQIASSTGLAPGCSNLRQLAVVPGGAKFLAACGFPYSLSALSTTTLAVAGSYPTGTGPSAVAVANDGTIATGPTSGIDVYSPAGTEINAFSPAGPGGLSYAGLALSPDGSQLYAVTGLGTGPFSLNVFDSPEVTRSTVTLTGPSTSTPGTAVTLTGTLAFSAGAPAQGTPVTISRANPDSTTTTLSASTTDASGDFSVTDTPPGNGSYTYTASYAGSSATASGPATTPATSEGLTTTVAPLSTTLNLYPASNLVPLGDPVTLTGTLWYGSDLPPQGTPVTVTRLNPNGTTTQITGITTSDARGDFTVTDDTASAAGSYTYTASVPATETTTSAQATTAVTVAPDPATLTLSGPASVLPGKAFSVSGKLSLAPTTTATGTPITVSRKNPNGSTTTITGIKTGASGAFTISDNLSTLGSYTYTASVPTTSDIVGATSTFTVTVVKPTPTLTLSTGHSTALYGSTITVTAHLGSTHTNRRVSISASFPGSRTVKVLKTGTVNSAGNLVVSFPDATRNVVFTVTFGGDSEYAAKSVSARVGVDARVAMSNSGWYTTTQHNGVTYRVFHSTGHLNVAVSVTPNKRGETLELVVQQLSGNTWSTVDVFDSTLSSSSTASGYLTLTQAAGAYYRLRAVFVPSTSDVTNVSYYSGWFYFQVVK